MLDFFKKNKLPSDFKSKKERFLSSFLNDGNHRWINEDRLIRRGISMLMDSLEEKHIDFFLKHPTYMIPCQAHLSCAIGRTQNHHLILVFPELKQILRSASSVHGIAILAHELGHIYYQHTENKIDTLQAQIEADDFAFQLGFGEELQEILLDHAASVDCRVRISKLTSKLITIKHTK
ncbi:MAG: hypothetical protein H7336_08530 [Bacteriovorax sp.]|nr:hypothetical protein [Bacteriovorax sp.]